MTKRIIGSIAILISILVLPFWVYLPVLFIAIIIFPFFWEGILFALLVDTVYGSGIETALYALILLIILIPIRENLRLNA